MTIEIVVGLPHLNEGRFCSAPARSSSRCSSPQTACHAGPERVAGPIGRASKPRCSATHTDCRASTSIAEAMSVPSGMAECRGPSIDTWRSRLPTPSAVSPASIGASSPSSPATVRLSSIASRAPSGRTCRDRARAGEATSPRGDTVRGRCAERSLGRVEHQFDDALHVAVGRDQAADIHAETAGKRGANLVAIKLLALDLA